MDTLPWTQFSGGELNNNPPTPGMGLLDFGGGVSMRNNYLVNVDGNNTLEFYDLGTGQYDSALSEGANGTWTDFTDGPLNGFTLAQLHTSPVGTYNGFSYRSLGNAEFAMFFEVNAIPEPSTFLFALGSLSVLGLCRGRR